MNGRALRAQTKLELVLNLRRGEAVLLTLIIPIGLLVFFGTTELFAVTVEFITPGLLALAVLSTSLVSLSIATGYERKYLVLKRLGATPLPRSVLFVAKAISVLALEIIQVGLLLGVAALVFGWRADLNWWLLIGALLLGTAAFTGIAMLMAGTLRAEATLALANGLYVIFLLVGDVIFPLESLPDAVVRIGLVLPAAPLAGLFRAAVGQADFVAAHAVVLIGWALLIPPLAVRFFTWEER
ncbi:MAG: ABC transporter permease [Acidimicrobiia bacterium]|nr:ABC transporter permease [Acidimicrobiia bacterium]